MEMACHFLQFPDAGILCMTVLGVSVVGVIIIALGFNLPSRFVEQIMRLWDGNGRPFSPVPRHMNSLHDSTGDFCGRGHNHCSRIYLKKYILKLPGNNVKEDQSPSTANICCNKVFFLITKHEEAICSETNKTLVIKFLWK